MTTEQKELRKQKSSELKIKHKTDKVYRLWTLDENGEEVDAWVKKPGFAELSSFTALSQKDQIRALKVLLNNVWLEGNEIIKEDTDCFMSVVPQLNRIIEVRQAGLEKY
jgi:acyl-CoA-binding protein